MKRSFFLSITMVILMTILSGCIISKTPNSNEVAMALGDQITFSVDVFPSGGTYAWSVDGAAVSGQASSYLYTATAGQHTLSVTATHFLGSDTQTWSITTPEVVEIIDIAGGTVSVDNPDSLIARAEVVIPSGALTDTTTVSISIASAPADIPGLPAGQCIDFGPTGTQFSAPVDLYIPYADTDDNGLIDGIDIPEDEVTVLYYNQTTFSWEDIPILDIDTVNNIVHIQTTHFSVYVTSVPIVIRGDTVSMSIWSYGEMPPGTQYVVGPGIEYITHDDGTVFITDRSVDIGDNTITVHHRIDYTFHGGGSVYGFNVGIYDIDWNRYGCVIGDVQVIEQRDSASVLEFGPDYVILQVGGACGGWDCGWGHLWDGPYDHSIKVRLVPKCNNRPPVAEAGPNQIVNVGATVTLNGTGSTDPDNNISSYLWQQTGGPTVTLVNANTSIAHFTASVAAGSSLTFRLTVTDIGGLQSTDTCTITVSDLPAPIIEILNSLVTIPAGSFMMGSTDDQFGYAARTTPVHQVTLQSFDIGKFEVTQAQYQAVMGTNPSYFQAPSYPGSMNRPVEQVTYWEARQFCTALSNITGRTFTLPSEAQWEYACRAGTTTLYSFGDENFALWGDYAWWYGNSDGTGGPYGTHPVGTKLPNPWGLYDMHGNVWEMCLDSWHTNYVGAPTDGSAWEPDTGSYCVHRGGSCGLAPGAPMRSAFREDHNKDLRSKYSGFRVVAVP